MASAALDQKTCFAIYRGERNKLIIPVTKEGERRFDLYSQSEVKQSDDGQVDSIDSGVELAYSTTDVDEPPSSVSSCGDTDAEDPRREPSVIDADNVVHIFCRYDSSTPDPAGQQPLVQQPPAASPAASALQQCDEYSSVVEIDGDCIIIHSRQDAPGEEAQQLLEESVQPALQDSEAVADACRWFFEKRSRASAADPATSGGDKNCTDRVAVEQVAGQQAPHPLTSKMALLRREMSSLVAQDEDLYRQLLALHSSIQTLKWAGADSLSPASSVSSLPDAAGSSCSPSSTLSSCFSRRSHISSDSSSHYEVVDPRFTSSTPLKPDKGVAVIAGSRFRPFARLSSGTRFGLVSPPSIAERMSPRSRPQHSPSTSVSKPATVGSRMSSLVLNPFSRRKSGAHSSHLSLLEIGRNGKEGAAGRKSGFPTPTQLPSIDSFTSLTLPRRNASSASKSPSTRSDSKDAR